MQKQTAMNPESLSMKGIGSMAESRGVLFREMEEKGVGKYLRSVYMQENGDLILADKCTCFADYSKPGALVCFSVTRDPKCAIDQHRGN